MSENPPAETRFARPSRSRPPVFAFAIAAANVAIYIAAVGGLDEGTRRFQVALLHAGALERSRIWDGELWRLVAAMFLHGGVLHLVVNTICIYFFAAATERSVGALTLAALYVLTGVAASAASLLGHDAISVGASGAGFGLVGFSLVAARDRFSSTLDWLLSPETFVFVLGLGAFVAASFAFGPGAIDHFAHLGGFLTGAAAGALWVVSRRCSPAVRTPVLVSAGVAYTSFIAVALVHWPGMGAQVGVAEALLRMRTAERVGSPDELERQLARARSFGLSGRQAKWWDEKLAEERRIRSRIREEIKLAREEKSDEAEDGLGRESRRIVSLVEEIREIASSSVARSAGAGASAARNSEEDPSRDIDRRLGTDSPAGEVPADRARLSAELIEWLLGSAEAGGGGKGGASDARGGEPERGEDSERGGDPESSAPMRSRGESR